MALTIFGACVNLFGTSATLGASFPAGLWLGEEPEDKTTLPFICMEHLGESTQWTTGAPYEEITLVRFTIFAVGADRTEQLALAVKAVFDPPAHRDMVIDSALVEKFERKNYLLTKAPFRSTAGQLVFQGQIDYEAWVERQRRT